MAGPPSRIEALRRPDKWYLGGGERLLWSPPFPMWLSRPGCWDEVHYFNHALFPVFTWTLLDDSGRPWTLERDRWSWTPAGVTCTLRPSVPVLHGAPLAGSESAPAGEVDVFEALAMDPEDRLCTEVTVEADAAAWEGGLNLVAWTAQPDTGEGATLPDGRPTRSRNFAAGPWGTVWTRTLEPVNGPALALRCWLALDRAADSWGVQLSEGRLPQPWWGLTPWSGPWHRPGLGEAVHQSGNSPHGLVYAGIHTRLRPTEGWDRVTILFEVLGEVGEDAAPGCRAEETAEAVRVAPGWAGTHAEDAPRGPGAPSLLLRRSTEAWEEALAGTPSLTCDDPYITAIWAHRWYALHLLEGSGGHGFQRYPAVCEGIGYFRIPISYSGHAHMRDLRWRHDPAAARGTLRNFLSNQREDGSLPGRIYHHSGSKTDFYHADWGGAVLAVDQAHPDAAFLQDCYRALGRYAEYFDRERDPDGTGLYDIHSHYETGQEYMSRYMAVSSEADTVGWEDNIRLKGVDATVYIYRLKQALGILAGRLGRTGEAAAWKEGAAAVAEAIRSAMWDPEAHWFSDVDPGSGERTGVKAAIGFYPFMTDLVTADHLPALWEHLLDPKIFWTPFPVPATSADDPWYDPDARWKGKRMNCPWNGRVWPMTNSHLFEALSRASEDLDPSLRDYAAHLLRQTVRMCFTGGDPGRPNTYEHYHPVTGQACFYRGIDDYMHSWMNDLILRWVVGFRPPPPEKGAGPVRIDPLDFGLERLACIGIPYRGRRYDVLREGDDLRVLADGEEVGAGRAGAPFDIPLPDRG